MSEKLPLYPTTTIAHLFNLSERRVQQLAKEGVIPKARHGKYELVGALRGYIKYLRSRANGQVNSDDEYQRERLRLLTVQADEKEQSVTQRRSQLITHEDAQQHWQAVVHETDQLFEPMPKALAEELGLDEQAQGVMLKEFSQVLDGLT